MIPLKRAQEKFMITPCCSSPRRKIVFVLKFFKRLALVTAGGDNCLHLLNNNRESPQKNGKITERAIYIFQDIFQIVFISSLSFPLFI